MDLKNNKITLGELLAYQPAKAIIQRALDAYVDKFCR